LIVTKQIVIEVEYDDKLDPPETWSWELGCDFDPHDVPFTRSLDVAHARYIREVSS
jgi:hypothetical protein